ncbi:hypothetical protein M422DRAFT_184119, partial [Sphaerobolus stellatus SS14]
EFLYLIDPLNAIQTFMRTNNPTTPVERLLDDFNFGAVDLLAVQADTCLMFTNADSGEGYITVDGNSGDRTIITLWHGDEALIQRTASSCVNTIVVMHIVEPVTVETWIGHPNATAIINAGFPGQESGTALVNVLFGAVNLSGRLPYTIAKQMSDYPADISYSRNDGAFAQITYDKGLNVDCKCVGLCSLKHVRDADGCADTLTQKHYAEV